MSNSATKGLTPDGFPFENFYVKKTKLIETPNGFKRYAPTFHLTLEDAEHTQRHGSLGYLSIYKRTVRVAGWKLFIWVCVSDITSIRSPNLKQTKEVEGHLSEASRCLNIAWETLLGGLP